MASFIEVKGIKGTKIKAIIRKKGYKVICKTFVNISSAKSWAKKIEVEMDNGTYIEENGLMNTQFGTVKIEYVEELINYFKENVAPTRYADASKYYCMYDWWIDKLKGIKVKKLSASNIAACKQILLTEKMENGEIRKPNTINKYLMCISSVLTYARDELELIEYNPKSKVKNLKKPKGRKRSLSIQERDKFLVACKAHSDMIYLFVLLALGTGGRYTEIQTLKVENIDYKNQRVYFLDTKNDTSRSVYIKEDIMDFLKKYLADNNIQTGYIFRGKRKNALPFIRGVIYKIIRDCDLKNFTVHDMRHTFASYGAEEGASLKELADILGQTAITVTENYTHLTQKHIDKVVKGFVDKIIPEI